MKRNRCATLLLIITSLAVSGCYSVDSDERVKPSTTMSADTFVAPSVDTFYLSNGIEVFFKEDNELPTFSGTLYVPRGSQTRTATDTAVYNALDDMLRGGGTTSLSPDALDQKLESLSAGINVSIAREYSTVSFSGLSGDANEIISLAHSVISEPGFNPNRLALWKSQTVDSIKKRGDSTDSIAGLSFLQLLFRGSNLGIPMKISDVDTVCREKLLSLTHQIFGNEHAVIAVSGALTAQAAKNILEQSFGKLPGSTVLQKMSSKPLQKFSPRPGFYFVEKDFPQAAVYVGELGPRRFVDDYPAIEAFNGVFGAGGEFGSMLTQAIRTERGLSYGVSGGIYRDEPVGKNFIGLQTKSKSVPEALLVSLQTLDKIQHGEIPAGRLDDVKTAAQNSFVFRYDSISAIVNRKALKELLNYPPSYDESFLSKIGVVAQKDVVDVANKYWHQDDLIILVVGDKNALAAIKKDPRLKKYSIKKLNFTTELQLP